MGFSQALSGLNAAAQNINVIGNNIANSQTYGFKSSSIQFADVYAGSKIGQGVRVAGVLQDFGNGTLDTTGRSMDLGINGEGFFRFRQGDQVVYSRNGQLIMTKDGFLENSNGARLTGFPAGVGAGGAPEPLQVPPGDMTANATTTMQAVLNLDASSSIIDPAVNPFDPADPDSYSYASTGTTYDSLGNKHIVTTYYIKRANNAWDVQVAMDGTVDPANAGQLTFDVNGVLDQTASTFPNVTFDPANGAAIMTYAMNFDGTTQFGNDFSVSSVNQDGYTSGSLVGIRFDKNGDVVGNYSNEVSRVLGTIVLTNFRNPEGLQPNGDNAWLETGASGQPIVGNAGVGMLGTLEGGTLEASNVDMAKALVNLIIAQRTYQANTQTVKTQDQILQATVNLR